MNGGGNSFNMVFLLYFVIASEAKQSMDDRKMDCFVASLSQ